VTDDLTLLEDFPQYSRLGPFIYEALPVGSALYGPAIRAELTAIDDPGSSTSPMKQKTESMKQCRFFLKGKCRYGKECKFSHAIVSLNREFGLRRSSSSQSPRETTFGKKARVDCRAWKAGHCPNGDGCRHVHDPQVCTVHFPLCLKTDRLDSRFKQLR
jgi:hypothetical protein